MVSASLKSRIDKLWNALGGKSKPDVGAIRGVLAQWSTLADELESGQSSIEAEKKIAVLEKAIVELEAQNKATEAKLQYAESQAVNLQSELEATRDELRRAQKQEDENEPLSTTESRILRFIDESDEALVADIAKALGVSAGIVRRGIKYLTSVELVSFEGEDDDSLPFYGLTKKARAWMKRERASNPEWMKDGAAGDDAPL